MRSWVVVVLLVVIGTVGCQHRDPYSTPADLEKEKIANAILRKVALKLKQESNLHPVGDMGQMLRNVQVLGLSFYYYQPVDIIEGRKLLIKAVNSLMDEINSESRIRPYLCRYPFTPRNIHIDIFILSPDGNDVAPGALWILKANEGSLRYTTHNPATHRLTDIYKETYDEALERLEDPSLPLVSFTPVPELSHEAPKDLSKSISLVTEDGAIWHLGENGCWIKSQK